MGCCAEYVVKYILFGFNLIFTLGGLALLTLGIIVQVKWTDVEMDNASLVSLSSIIVGSAIFVIAFFGCCGAIRENRCFLATYAILMIVLMIIMIVVGVVMFVERSDVLDEVQAWLTKTFDDNRDHFLQVQSTFSCCGTTGPVVFLPGAVPASCCPSPPCNVVNSYDGCLFVVHDFFNSLFIAIGVIVLVIAGVQLIAAIFAFVLSRHIGQKQSVQLASSS